MGTKYTTQSASGYNSSPPPDDGTTVASNKITWAGIKTKLADSIKTLADAINSQIVNALDYSISTASTAYTTVAGDHEKMIGATGTTTISLGDATTMAVGYRAGVSNDGTAVVTVAVITATDTLNGQANGTVKLLPGQAMWFVVNSTHVGYDIYADANRATVILTSSAGTTSVTAACDSTIRSLSANQLFLLIPANTSVGATTINITPSGGSAFGAKNVFNAGSALVGGELQQNVPCILEYDGTQLNIIGPSALNITKTQSASTILSGPLSGAAATPTFKTAASVGASLVLFGSYTVAGTPSVVIVGDSNSGNRGVINIDWSGAAYDDIVCRWYGHAPTGASNIAIQVSHDSGATFISSGNYVSWAHSTDNTGTGTDASSGAIASLHIGTTTQGTSLAEESYYELQIIRPFKTDRHKIFKTHSHYVDSASGNFLIQNGGGRYIASNSAINSIQFLVPDGPTTFQNGGILRVFGVRNS